MLFAMLVAFADQPLLSVDLPGLCVAYTPQSTPQDCPGLQGSAIAAVAAQMPQGMTQLLSASIKDGEGQAVLYVVRTPPLPEPIDRFAATRDMLGGYVNSFGLHATSLADLPTRGLHDPNARFESVAYKGLPASRFQWTRSGVVTHGAIIFSAEGVLFVQAMSMADGGSTLGSATRNYVFEAPAGQELPAPPQRARFSVEVGDHQGRISLFVDPLGVGVDALATPTPELQELATHLAELLAEQGVGRIRTAGRKTGECPAIEMHGETADLWVYTWMILDGTATVQLECTAPTEAPRSWAKRACRQVTSTVRRAEPTL